MSKPFSVNIKRVKCYSINDYTGEDDLYGTIGPVSFPIGSFSPGNDYNLDINQVVPVGELILTILERDVTADDILGYIDLSEVMDVDRTVNISGADANYDFSIYVTSVSD